MTPDGPVPAPSSTARRLGLGCLGMVLAGAFIVVHWFVTLLALGTQEVVGVLVGIAGLALAAWLFRALAVRGHRALAIGYAIGWVIYLLFFGGCLVFLTTT